MPVPFETGNERPMGRGRELDWMTLGLPGPGKPGTPTTSPDNPIAHGTEVFFERRLPDGTPLSTEERRYIAALVVADLRAAGSFLETT